MTTALTFPCGIHGNVFLPKIASATGQWHKKCQLVYLRQSCGSSCTSQPVRHDLLKRLSAIPHYVTHISRDTSQKCRTPCGEAADVGDSQMAQSIKNEGRRISLFRDDQNNDNHHNKTSASSTTTTTTAIVTRTPIQRSSAIITFKLLNIVKSV